MTAELAVSAPRNAIALRSPAGTVVHSGRAAYDVDACAEAVRLAELLHDLLPDPPTPAAGLALLLLTEARRPARLDEHGDVVTLRPAGSWSMERFSNRPRHRAAE